MILTIPSMKESGIYISKSIEFLKVTVHPKERRSKIIMSAESAIECKKRNIKSKN
jgi:hypothetical protein